MRLTINTAILKRGLATVSHAVATRSTLPVLSNILLSADDGRLKLTATNLEIAISCWLPCQVDDEGAVTLPAKLLLDLVGSLPSGDVQLSLDDMTQAVAVRAAKTKATIKGIDAVDFPPIPTAGAVQPIAYFAPEALRDAITRVVVAAATDDSRSVLQGVLLRLRGNQATFSATDGFRLAVRTIQMDSPTQEPLDVIIPGRTLTDLARILGDVAEPVALSQTPGGGQLLFTTSGVDVVSRIIEGKFPDYERIIPQSHTTRTVLDTAALMQAVKRAGLFAATSGNVIKLIFAPGGDIAPAGLLLSANASEVGDNTEEVDALIEGDGGQIALNAKYLQDAIASIGTAQIVIETQAANAPGVFRPVGVEGMVHLCMPMSVR